MELPGHPSDKSPDEMYLRRTDLAHVLGAIETESTPTGRRDYTMLYLSFFFALRAGEACILERKHFRFLDRKIVYVPTLKRNFKITATCPHCDKKMGVRWTRAGKPLGCRRCAEKFIVPKELADGLDRNPPDVELPFVEPSVRKHVQTYLDEMPKKQRWLFEGVVPGEHICVRHVQRIFASYAAKAGLSDKYGFHSLRHGRGVDVWEAKHDRFLLKQVMRHSSEAVGERYIHLSPEVREQFEADFEKRNQELSLEKKPEEAKP
jgi:integrase